jgi:hypothetical protein
LFYYLLSAMLTFYLQFPDSHLGLVATFNLCRITTKIPRWHRYVTGRPELGEKQLLTVSKKQ